MAQRAARGTARGGLVGKHMKGSCKCVEGTMGHQKQHKKVYMLLLGKQACRETRMKRESFIFVERLQAKCGSCYSRERERER